jgi:hypothetical protein
MTNSRYDEEQWTPEEFFEKMGCEGGVDGMLGWGGFGVFPPQVRALAQAAEEALTALRAELWKMEESLS